MGANAWHMPDPLLSLRLYLISVKEERKEKNVKEKYFFLLSNKRSQMIKKIKNLKKNQI